GGHRHLDRRGGQLVAHGVAGGAGTRPLLRRAQASCRLRGKLDARERAEPEVRERHVLLFGSEPRRELRDGDIARDADRVGKRERGLRVVIGDRATEHTPLADRKSTRLNSSHGSISYAVFCLKKKNTKTTCVTRHAGLEARNKL